MARRKMNLKKVALYGGGAVGGVLLINYLIKKKVTAETEALVKQKAAAGATTQDLTQTIMQDSKVQDFISKVGGTIEEKTKVVSTAVGGILNSILTSIGLKSPTTATTSEIVHV